MFHTRSTLLVRFLSQQQLSPQTHFQLLIKLSIETLYATRLKTRYHIVLSINISMVNFVVPLILLGNNYNEPAISSDKKSDTLSLVLH